MSDAKRSPARTATLIAIPVALIAAFVTFLVLARGVQNRADESLAAGHLRDVPAPSATEPACRGLLDAMPAKLGEFARTDQSVAGYARWNGGGTPAVELRCGTERPAQLSRTAKLQVVDGVQWLQVPPADTRDAGSVWVAVDHRPYVSLWLPENAGTAPIQAASDAITAHLQSASLDLGN